VAETSDDGAGGARKHRRRDDSNSAGRAGAFVPSQQLSRKYVEEHGPEANRLQNRVSKVGIEPADPVPLLPQHKCHTDEFFCGGDAFNAGAGEEVLNRTNTATASNKPLELQASATMAFYQRVGFDLKGLHKHNKAHKKSVWGAVPRLADVMREPCGIFLFEFYWQGGTLNDWHVVTVNCDSRWLFCTRRQPFNFTPMGSIRFCLAPRTCAPQGARVVSLLTNLPETRHLSFWRAGNTLGYISFCYKALHESEKTHAQVVDCFKIRFVSSLYSLWRRPSSTNLVMDDYKTHIGGKHGSKFN